MCFSESQNYYRSTKHLAFDTSLSNHLKGQTQGKDFDLTGILILQNRDSSLFEMLKYIFEYTNSFCNGILDDSGVENDYPVGYLPPGLPSKLCEWKQTISPSIPHIPQCIISEFLLSAPIQRRNKTKRHLHIFSFNTE